MFNFWPFNVARKRREEAHRQAQERLIAAFREDCQQRAKRNKVIPMDDPRHPRNLSPQQRADRIAAMRPELGVVYHGSQRQTFSGGPKVIHNLPRDQPSAGMGLSYDHDADQSRLVVQHSDERRMEPAPAEAVALVQQFRCAHPAISEFWQEQQARCDSPTDTSSPSCDAPSTDN